MDPVYPQSASLPNGTHRVVEVVDCLADTVVAVTQLEPQKGTRQQKVFLAALLFFAMITGASFLSAVSVVRANKAAKQLHLAEGKVAHEFRPKRISNALEIVGIGSLAAVFVFSFAFVAGRRKESDHFMAELPSSEADVEPSFEMVKVSSGSANVRIHPAMNVSVLSHAGVANSNQLCEQGMATREADGWLCMPLVDGENLSVAMGDRSYQVHWTTRGNRKALAVAGGVDSRFVAYIGISAAATLMLVGLLNTILPDTYTFGSDNFSQQARLVTSRSTPFQDPIVEPEDGESGDDTAEQETVKASEAGAAGTTGIETATKARASMAIQRRADRASMSKEQIRGLAKHSGFLGVFSESQVFANINSNDDFASGDSAQDWHGGFEGGPVGDQVGRLNGTWGNDVHGFSGTWGTVKVPSNSYANLSFNTNGRCNNPAGCRDGGTGHETKLRKHVTKSIKLKIGTPKLVGDIDPSIIRRLIRSKLSRIRYCYEERLIANPGLRGTIVSAFTIGPNGAVIGSKAKGMGDAGMGRCVASAISSIQFPKVPGGGLVNVNYPFTFQPAGG